MRHTIKQKEGETMELRVLRYFLAVARGREYYSGGRKFTCNTADVIKTAYGFGSTAWKNAFLRGKRKITLTEEGMFLRKRAQEIVDLADKTEAELMTSDDVVEGNIYIGAGETQGFI